MFEKTKNRKSHPRQDYNTKKVKLFVPNMNELADSMKNALDKNFKHVSVDVVKCPDLRLFGCASQGLSGHTALCDVGGVPFLLNPEWQDVYFELRKILNVVGMPKGTALGAAAAWNGRIGVNGELMPYASVNNGTNTSHFSIVDRDGNCECNHYPYLEQGPLSNMFLCDGIQGDVIKVEVEVRTGEENLVSCIRKGLIETFNCRNGRQIGIGGVFIVKKGKVKMHVMPDFYPSCMVDGSEQVVKEWLKYYEVGPNLLCLSTMLTGDPSETDMHLRLEHTHFYSMRQDKPTVGGHYHNDVTPEIVRYVGYFSPAEFIFRIRDAWEEVPSKN